MTTQSDPKIRLFIVIAAIALTSGFLVASVAFRDKEEIVELVESVEHRAAVRNNWEPGEDHPLVEPTDFYASSLLEGEAVYHEAAYTKDQISRQSIMLTLLLHDGDLLADQSFNVIRDVVSNDQLLEAKMLARKYDSRLKEVRRERARILEQVGVTIKDPTQDLEKIRIRTFQLFTEARSEIITKILDKSQQEKVVEKFVEQREYLKAEAARRAKQAAKENL